MTLTKGQKITINSRQYTVKVIIEIPYKLNEFLLESDRTEPLVFYVAKPMVGREIYIGYETKEDVEKLFKACKVDVVDLERYYEMKEIENV